MLAEVHQEATRLYGDSHQEIATLLQMRGYTLGGLGRFDEAEALHRQGLAVEADVYGESNGQSVVSLLLMAQTQIRAGRGPTALETLARARGLAERHLQGNEVIALNLGLLHALALEVADRFDEAATSLAALAPKVREQLADSTALAMTLDGIGRSLVRSGRVAEAARYHEEALSIMAKHYEPTSLELVPTLSDLGFALLAADRARDGVAVFERALAILGAEPSDPLSTAEVRLGLSGALAPTDPSRTSALRDEALATARSSPYPRAVRLVQRATSDEH